jgi:zinc transport system substrate-binding protein
MCRPIAGGLLVILSLAAGVACRPSTPPNGGVVGGAGVSGRQGKPTVYVVNYPLEFFASRIGGDLVDVQFPTPSDADPAFWKPDDATVAKFQQADVILLNGAGYAKWTQQVSLPDSRLFDTSRLYQDKLIRVDDNVVHSHGPGGEHSHQGVAFTTWLDPQLAMLQAEQVHTVLAQLLPAKTNTKQLEANYRQLNDDLEELAHQLDEVAERYQDEPLFASHPVYQYLSRRCGWNLKSLHWEPDEVPKADQWETFSRSLESHPSKWMLWEAEPHRETAEKLAAIGVTSIVFEPCGNRPEKDYLQVMADNIQRLTTIFPK